MIDKMIYVINPIEDDMDNIKESRLHKVLSIVLKGYEYKVIRTVEEFKSENLKNKRILFAIDIGHVGINVEYSKILKYLRGSKETLKGSFGSMIIDGNSEFFTKNIARGLAFTANNCGCEFPGRPLVEATGSLKNFNLQAKLNEMDNMEAYIESCRILVHNLVEHHSLKVKGRKARILALHSSNFKTSNTLLLWDMIKSNFDKEKIEIEEISLANGTLVDCRGCPHNMCMHFSEQNSCYYGGQIVKEVYPAILDCDALIMICPNYNDAVGANLTAFINRLTSLFKTHRFYDKKLFAIIVSGYSGGDIVAQQLVSAINMNKTFTLPPYFSICETANNVNEILLCEDIVEKARTFAQNISSSLI